MQNDYKNQEKELLRCTGSLKDALASGKDYFEIRLESIGGLGANLCGKMLGELGLRYLDLNSSNFSSYGSEKTGTPVKCYIRYAKKEKEIRVHSPIVEPDLLVIFHQALLKDASVWKGCGENTAVLIALEQGDQEAGNKEQQECSEITDGKQENAEQQCSRECEKKGRKNKEKQERKSFGMYYGIEAQKIAMETHSRINVVMLGAILKVMGIEDAQAGEQICRDALGKKYPDALPGNLKGLRRGYEEVRELEDKKRQSFANTMGENTQQKNPVSWGYETAPIGGIIQHLGSTVVADLSPSRQGYIPVFIKERCINCGLCHSTCPDMVFQFEKGEYKGREMMVNQGLDYYHCKGCLRCVNVCPVNALVQGKEADYPKKDYFLPNQELLRKPDYYEESGADGYITSESYLTARRMEGGEV